jgi:hypothetical protein
VRQLRLDDRLVDVEMFGQHRARGRAETMRSDLVAGETQRPSARNAALNVSSLIGRSWLRSPRNTQRPRPVCACRSRRSLES